MNKKIVFVMLFGLIVLLSGCIKLNYTETISENGTSAIEAKMDMSKLAVIAKSQAEASGEEFTPEKLCARVLEDQQATAEESGLGGLAKRLENINCTATEDFIVTITGTRKLEQGELTVGNTLIYTLKLESGKTQELGNQGVQAVETLKASGFEMKYTVVMPGRIIRAEGATIENNKATFDMLELLTKGQTSITVESEKAGPIDIASIALAVVAILILIIIGAVLVIKRPKKPVSKNAS